MNRKMYIIPALVSVGVHGLCFLTSSNEPSGPFPGSGTFTNPPEVTLKEDFVPPPEPEETTNEVIDIKTPAARLGEPLPGLDEVARIASPKEFVMDVPPRPMSDSTATLHIGPPGVPDGVIDGEVIASVKPTAISSDMLDASPTARLQTRPNYPHSARSEGRNGTVMVDFVVNERGEVIRVTIVSSTDAIFEEPTRNAVYRWRFAPGLKDGRPVAFKMRVPVSFKIDA